MTTTTIMNYVSITPNSSPVPLPSQPQAITNLLSVTIVLPFPGFYTKAILGIFFVFDFSLKMLLRVIHTAR